MQVEFSQDDRETLEKVFTRFVESMDPDYNPYDAYRAGLLAAKLYMVMDEDNARGVVTR